MKNFSVLFPIINNGNKYYPVEAWTSQIVSQRVIAEYFKTERAAEKYCERMNEK